MTAAQQIDNMITETKGWRGVILGDLRICINAAGSHLTEEWKWSTAVWTCNGLVCAISSFKDHVKINFFKGAHLNDPYKIFNNGLASKEHRSIDFCEGDTINTAAITALVRAAVVLNIK